MDPTAREISHAANILLIRQDLKKLREAKTTAKASVKAEREARHAETDRILNAIRKAQGMTIMRH